VGLSLGDYLDMTPAQFAKAYEKFIEKTQKDREFTELVNWQVARWQVWRTLCPPPGEELSVVDLLELPGDRPEAKAGNKSTKKRFEELAKKWK
jgi:hypothetical protein